MPPDLPKFTHRDWSRADELGRVALLRGRRVILVNEEGSHHEWRAWTGLIDDVGRPPALLVIPEGTWWDYILNSATPPDPTRWPAACVWVECDDVA